MGAFTSRFSLYKPGGGSTGLIVPDEILDIDKLNSNFDIIDANLGAFIATSTTLPGVPKTGQFVYETDTGNTRIYSGGAFVLPNNVPTIPDVTTLPSAAIEGRRIHVDAMNVDFQAVDGVWVQQGVATFADAATRDTEYAKSGATYRIAGVQARTVDVPGAVLEYAGVYATPGNLNGRETTAGWFIVYANIRRHYDNVINIGSTATGTNIPAAALVVRRRTYAQRVSVKFAGSISGTISGGMGITASAGGTVISNFGAIAIGGSGVAYAGQSYVDIAAGVGADVTISGGTIGTGPMIIGGLLTYDILLPSEYS